jgi:hypothetical protein
MAFIPFAAGPTALQPGQKSILSAFRFSLYSPGTNNRQTLLDNVPKALMKPRGPLPFDYGVFEETPSFYKQTARAVTFYEMLIRVSGGLFLKG